MLAIGRLGQQGQPPPQGVQGRLKPTEMDEEAQPKGKLGREHEKVVVVVVVVLATVDAEVVAVTAAAKVPAPVVELVVEVHEYRCLVVVCVATLTILSLHLGNTYFPSALLLPTQCRCNVATSTPCL